MTTPVIVATNVSKSVTSNEHTLSILQDVSLKIEQGESIAFIGVSGAGKSTLMTLLAGLDVPSSGDISIFDQSLTELTEDERAHLRAEHLGFVFQQFLLVPSLTALENVLLPASIRGDAEDQMRAQTLLESVGLAHRVNHLPSQLSGGEQQRVAIARAFMTRPKILFADEPTGNLDQATAATVIDLLFDLNREYGTSLVLVTHDPQLAQKCDRILALNAGCLVEKKG